MSDAHPLTPPVETRRSIRTEIGLVALITLGFSGLSAVVSLIETQIRAARAHQSLSQQVTTVVASQSEISAIDLARQLLVITRLLAWGLLGVYLLWRSGEQLSRRLGLDLRRPGRDAAAGVGLAALIGIPGLGFYVIAHAIGISVTVQASTLTDTWWRLPVSLLLAAANAFVEEVLVVGYLLTRFGHLRVPVAVAIGLSAVLRGSYHLYQGYGAFIGNAVMGVVFALVYLRWRRLWPLVLAHTLIDSVVFIGYPLLHGHVSWLP